MTDTKAKRSEALRYKRPALSSLGYDALMEELWEIREACDAIHWFIGQGDETLLNALEGDEDAVWEFRMAFSDLEAKADALEEAVQDWDGGDFQRDYDDCTVALIGNRYNLIGYDTLEEDYLSMSGYQRELAYTEAGKRLSRRTKADMLSVIGQCVGILVAFLDLRQQYDYLRATFDILRDENTSLLNQVKEIDAAYEAASAAGFQPHRSAVRQFDRLLAALPDRAWVE